MLYTSSLMPHGFLLEDEQKAHADKMYADFNLHTTFYVDLDEGDVVQYTGSKEDLSFYLYLIGEMV